MSSRVRTVVAPVLLLVVTGVGLGDAEAGGRLIEGPLILVGAVVGAYLVGAWLPPMVAGALGLVAAGLMTGANQLAQTQHYSVANDFFFFALVLGGVELVAALITARRRQAAELRRLTALRTTQLAGEVRAVQLDELTRIDARITRSMMQQLGAILVLASGVRRQSDPGAAREAIGTMEQAGRGTLDQLREALGSLHAPESPAPRQDVGPTDRLPLAPLGWVDVLVAACGTPVAVEVLAGGVTRGPVVLNMLAGVALGLPLLWRRTHPLPSVATALLVAVLMSAFLTPPGHAVTPLLPLSLATFAAGAHTRGRGRWAALALVMGGVGLIAVVAPASAQDDSSLLPTSIWVLLTFSFGIVAAQHAQRADELAALLEQVERGRDQELRLAVAGQRQVVARELHDTVAHAMTVVCLHAEVAQRQADDAAVLATALGVVEDAAREAMERLRRGLDTLQPGADDLDPATEIGLFAAAVGVEPSVRISEVSPQAWPVVERVVREGLVNASRHAGGARCRVLVERTDESYRVEVHTAAGPASPFTRGAGVGLQGLTSLVEGHGGRLEHGRTDDGGFLLAALLPFPSPVPA